MTPSKKRRARKYRSPKLTRIEKLTKGLLEERAENDFFAVKEIPGKGRGVFLRTKILRKDSFVLEYKGDVIPEAEASYRERIYALNNEGCFIMSFSYQGTKLAIDATRQFESFARLMNHSRQPNIRFHAPFVIDLQGLPRIASYALRDIKRGEEIVIDYGVRDGDISWLRNREVGFVDLDLSNSINYASDSTSPPVRPSARTTRNSTKALVINVETPDSGDKNESSSMRCVPISLTEAVKAKTASVEPADVYVVSADECITPQIGASSQQLKCPDLCNEQGKLASNWPARRPVGFSSPSTQQKVAVIKPYVTPSRHGATSNDAVAMTESELEHLRKIILRPLFNSSSYQQIKFLRQNMDQDETTKQSSAGCSVQSTVEQVIYKNDNFFMALIKRGISIGQIRTTITGLFKKTAD